MRTDADFLAPPDSGNEAASDRPQVRPATVAIVMSNYNHARYLEESLGGIRSQTRPADEVILIDDGSTDRSVEILERFAAGDPKVHFLRNQQRLGLHASISRALPLVKSDYLVWTAADDRLLHEFLERSMAALERHPRAGLCFSETTQLLGDTGTTLRFATEPSVRHTFDLSDLPEYLSPRDIVRRMKRAYLPIAANTVVVKREALIGLKGYPQELEWHADSFAYTVIALRHGACVIPETLAIIRASAGSYSHAMYDPPRQTIVLERMLDMLASPQYSDIRRIFRACPSNFSPGLGLMLRVQGRRMRDWDLFLTYFAWKISEYKRGNNLNWAGMFVHLLQRLPYLRRIRFLETQLKAAHRAYAAEKASFESLLQAERDGFSNALHSLRCDYEAAKASVERYQRTLNAVRVATEPDLPASSASAIGEPAESAMAAMVQEITQSEPIYAPSRFWRHYNEFNLKQLAAAGFGNFKLTANQNYHNFTPTSLFDAKIRRLIRLWKDSPSLKPLLISIESGFARMSSDATLRTHQAILGFSNKHMFTYQVFVSLLWAHSKRIDRLHVLDRMQEPDLGNPIRVLYGERLISQDLATSSREFNAIMQVVEQTGAPPGRLVIAELGAGYGRLAHVFAQMTGCRYLVFDIPPALAVAQWYLGGLFPNKRIFRFRRFDSFEQIAQELERSDIAFFTPNQLARFPDHYVDLFLSISSLHEMRIDQIQHYLAQMSRLTSRYIYLKQYYRYVNRHDNIVIERGVYRLPPEWTTMLERTEEVYTDFFELMLKRAA